MPDVNLWVVLVSTVLAFVLGAGYYVVLGTQLAQVSDAAASDSGTPWWTMVVEVLRCLVLAAVVAGLAAQGRVDTWSGGLVLGLVLWIGFPAVLWVGAIVHENTPWRLAAIHAGDWLVKLLVVGVVVSVWQ
jgi:hypothetical protein